VTTRWTGTQPSTAEADAVVGQARGSDAVVMVIGSPRLDRKQRRLAERLAKLATPLVVVAAGLPHDVRWTPGADALLITDSSSRHSMRGLAALLRGAVEPTGRLPVDIPRADAPG
jgi:beta-N-acetylhexosaminidase